MEPVLQLLEKGSKFTSREFSEETKLDAISPSQLLNMSINTM